MRYVSDLHRGRLKPRLLHIDLDLGETSTDLSEFLRKNLVDAEDVDRVMTTVEPPFPTYRRTLEALRTYMALSERDDGRPLPSSLKAIHPGDAYSGMPRLIQLLTLLGDLAQHESGPVSSAYAGPVVAAIEHFQRRHGLDTDGIIGNQTLKELNTPLSQHVAEFRLTLERWRWVPHQVSAPAHRGQYSEFELRAINDKYQWALSMKVVVGKAYGHETPVFASDLKSVNKDRPYYGMCPCPSSKQNCYQKSGKTLRILRNIPMKSLTEMEVSLTQNLHSIRTLRNGFDRETWRCGKLPVPTIRSGSSNLTCPTHMTCICMARRPWNCFREVGATSVMAAYGRIVHGLLGPARPAGVE